MMEAGSLCGASSGSGFASAVSGSQGNQLRLVDCPHCGCRVICIRSKQPDTFNELFFKCPNNVKGDPRTCGFIRSEHQYETYLRMLDAQKQQIDDVAEARTAGVVSEMKDQLGQLKNQFDEFKNDFEEMKLQLDRALADIWDLKLQICGVKEQLFEGKKIWEMGGSLVLVVCVGALLGMVVTMLWK